MKKTFISMHLFSPRQSLQAVSALGLSKTLIFTLAAAALCACASKNAYVIEGSIAGLEGTVYLYKGNDAVDSVVVKEGRFRFEGVAEQPAIYYVSDMHGEAQTYTFAQQFVLEPGKTVITKTADDETAVVTGTPSNEALGAFNQTRRALIAEYRDAATTDERREAIESELDSLADAAYEVNRGNYFGAMLLKENAYYFSGQELLDEIAKFPAELQATELLTELKEHAEQKIRTEVGNDYIDIEQPNAEGETVSLKSVVENPAVKYTLVDFWASWCGPCMGEVPHLKKTYKEFHKKGFEIYGVSFDRTRDKWLAAVEQNGMNWIHVSEVNGFDTQATKDYAVQSIPTNYLIDAEGKIVAKNLRGEALYQKVSELLAE